MNIYDFDETIFYPNSAWTFGSWCYWRHFPRTLLAFPYTLWAAIQLLFGRISMITFKIKMFYFMRFVPDPERDIREFWDKYEGNISAWYLKQKSPDDVIVSATPDFLINEIGRRLGVQVVASRVDVKTGKLIAPVCADEEKVRRIKEAYPDSVIKEAYSDSTVDAPMIELAEKAYMVIDKGQKIIPWPNK